MFRKPFRPPLIQRKPTNESLFVDRNQTEHEDAPPSKKRRISGQAENDQEPLPSSSSTVPSTARSFRPPLGTFKTPAAPQPTSSGSSSHEGEPEQYFNVLWRNPTRKVHKTWDGDGILTQHAGRISLQDVSGREMGRTTWTKPLEAGDLLTVGGKEVEIESVLAGEVYLRGRAGLGTKGAKKAAASGVVRGAGKETGRGTVNIHAAVKQEKGAATPARNVNPVAPRSVLGSTRFKTPLLQKREVVKVEGNTPVPKHDPTAPNALVLKRPKNAPRGKQIVDVVVDPILSKHLRPHQREGVAFLYECVMGMRDSNGEGAILADEMGLGKTLQTITLLWTLLKQNPVYEDSPVVKKALIVCPATLVDNWRKEFRKWLGNERIGVFIADPKKKRITDFTRGKSWHVMIIGYEALIKAQDDLIKGSGVDIVICDESHRLKTEKNKALQAIKNLNTDRRVVLTGTPMQNNLGEFYIVADFVNPGVFGKYSAFKRDFEVPIVKSREDGASEKDVEKGKEREEELQSLCAQFMLRRTADILSKYLPPKTEYVLFCRPTAAQVSVYRGVLGSPVFGAVLGNSQASLQLIDLLKKVCNSPSLLRNKTESPTNEHLATLLTGIPPKLLSSPGASAKLQVLDSLLHQLRTQHPSEKVVIISNYTSTLDILGTFLTSLSYTHLRLDGSTPKAKRQDLVDTFNRTDSTKHFAFLLSIKAGGVGLNLIGASRLILYDVDWNPAHDLQAMARIHRDGQKRQCFIYRLLTAGAMDEKIFQRQVTKMGLADRVVDGRGAGVSGFSQGELRDLFSLDESSGCRTHEVSGCECGGRGVPVADDEDEDGGTGSGSVTPVVMEEEEEDKAVAKKKVNKRKAKGNVEPPQLIRASQVDMEAQEKELEERKANRKGENKLQPLMQYLHVDTELLKKSNGEDEAGEAEEAIDDDVLLNILKEDGNRVRYVFAKTTKHLEKASKESTPAEE